MSLLKSMSLLHVYSSPPSKRKMENPQRIQEQEKSESQEEMLPTDSVVSSNESIPNRLKLDNLKAFPIEINSTEISEVKVDDRFISPVISDAARTNKETHKRSQKKKTKAVENTYRKGTDDYSNNIHHVEILKVCSNDSMEKRQITEKRKPEMGKEETLPTDSLSSNESIPNHLKLDNLKLFHAEINSSEISEVEVDDRFRSPENSVAARTNKDTHKRSQKKKTKAVAKTYRNGTDDYSNNIHHAEILKVCPNNTKEKFRITEKRKTEMGKTEDKESSDDVNSPVNYRTETQRMFVQQQKMKEKTTYTPFNITASHVYIQSTHLTQSQRFSTDSGSS